MKIHNTSFHHKLRYWAKKNYRYYKTKFLDDPKKPTVVIHQMGKVGSTSLLHSLSEYSDQLNVYHSHSLSYESLKNNEDEYKLHFAKMGTVYEHFIHSLYLRHKIDVGDFSKKWKVITLVRDPIARDISAFFQQFLWKFDNDFDFMISSIGEEETAAIIQNMYLNEFVNHESWFNMTSTWIDAEVNRIFQTNIYEIPFNKKTGYQIYNSEIAEIFLLRLENMNRDTANDIGFFLGIDGFELKKGNVGSEKFYRNAYQAFKKYLNLPKEYIESTYSSNFVKHFYSAEEIEKFKSKWTG